MKVFGYIRVSGAGQSDGQGFDRQIDIINTYISHCRIGYAPFELVKVYTDVHTGTADALDRPGFSQMIADLNGIRTIIVERLDRLARSVTVQEQAITWLAAHDVDLIVADTGENVTEAYMADPMKRALIQIQGVFAELEKSMIVKKLRLAREKAKTVRNGKCEGQKAFGEVDAAELDVVKMIRVLRIQGDSFGKIARKLDLAGIKTRNGGSWQPSTVRSIVKGRVYKAI